MNALIQRMAAAQYEVVRQNAIRQGLNMPLWLQIEQKDRDFVISHVRAGLMVLLETGPSDNMRAAINAFARSGATDPNETWPIWIKALLAEGLQ